MAPHVHTYERNHAITTHLAKRTAVSMAPCEWPTIASNGPSRCRWFQWLVGSELSGLKDALIKHGIVEMVKDD